jgi:hypothetical protein
MYVTDSVRRQPSMTVKPPPPPPPPLRSPQAQKKNTLWRCQIRPDTTKTGYKPCISRCFARKKCGLKHQHQIIPADLIKTPTKHKLEYTASPPPPHSKNTKSKITIKVHTTSNAPYTYRSGNFFGTRVMRVSISTGNWSSMIAYETRRASASFHRAETL